MISYKADPHIDTSSTLSAVSQQATPFVVGGSAGQGQRIGDSVGTLRADGGVVPSADSHRVEWLAVATSLLAQLALEVEAASLPTSVPPAAPALRGGAVGGLRGLAGIKSLNSNVAPV